MNNPANAIDPDGNAVIFVNGYTLSSLEKGSQWYWRQYSLQTSVSGSWGKLIRTPVQTGRAFDLEVSAQLHDDNRFYVNGSLGMSAGNRYSQGFDLGYSQAAEIIASLHRTNGVIDETIKFITHSMGGVTGDGFYHGLMQYINENSALKSQVSVSLIADFDPYQASNINNDGSVKKDQLLHSGSIANQKEKGDFNLIESPDKKEHSINSFYDDIPTLEEGTYKYNTKTKKWKKK